MKENLWNCLKMVDTVGKFRKISGHVKNSAKTKQIFDNVGKYPKISDNVIKWQKMKVTVRKYSEIYENVRKS